MLATVTTITELAATRQMILGSFDDNDSEATDLENIGSVAFVGTRIAYATFDTDADRAVANSILMEVMPSRGMTFKRNFFPNATVSVINKRPSRWAVSNLGGLMNLRVPANDNNGLLGRIYTFDEAATELHISKRSLQEIIKRLPFYAKNGRVYLFSQQDIRSIWEGMRCPYGSSNAEALTTGISVAPSESNLYSKARALTTRRPPKQSASSVRLAS